MTSTQMQRFRHRLEQNRADILAQLDSWRNQLIEDEEIDETLADESDAATRLVDQEEISAQRAQLKATLAQIDKALARIADGTYGLSEISGQPIPLERLEALPYATTLVNEPAGNP